jgi:hypothetical protein
LLAEPSSYKNCSVYLSKFGWTRAKLEGEAVKTDRKIPLTDYRARLGLKCFNLKTGKRAEKFFLIIKGREREEETSSSQ